MANPGPEHSDALARARFAHVVIIGPGLIGGSLGLALRRGGLARRVTGVGHRTATLEEGVRLGALDDFNLHAVEAVPDADLVVLATGVDLILKQSAEILPRMKPDAVLTDVGSVKGTICAGIERLYHGAHTPRARFVGGHPLAGSEKRGIAAARADLFHRALCILTPSERTDPGGVARASLRALWETLGCVVREMSPATHDRLLAEISHLPHAAAACLVNAVSDEAHHVAARGFLDTTRVASGDPLLWTEICLANRESLGLSLRALAREADALAGALERGDADAVTRLLARAKERRDAIDRMKGG